MCGWGSGHEVVRGRAWRRGVAIQAAGVAGTATLSAVAVDGCLQLARRAQAFLLALKGVEILHVPDETSYIDVKNRCVISGKKIHRRST